MTHQYWYSKSGESKHFVVIWQGFPGGWGVKNLPADVEDEGLIPDLGEDPTCPGAAKPVTHSYWALDPGSRNYWSPHVLEPALHCNKRSHCNEKSKYCN